MASTAPDCPDCPDCDTTVRVVQQLHRGAVCPGCGAEYLADPSTAPPPPAHQDDDPCRRTTLPGPAPSRRVQVVRDPSILGERWSAPPPAGAVEDPVERTALLLDELQVDLVPTGTLGRDAPAEGAGVDWSRPVVQCVPQWGASIVTAGAVVEDVDDTIAARTVGHPDERDTLLWLRRRSGLTGASLRKGGEEGDPTATLRDMHGRCGYDLAHPEVRARFDAVREALDVGAPIAGRRRIAAAMLCWWG